MEMSFTAPPLIVVALTFLHLSLLVHFHLLSHECLHVLDKRFVDFNDDDVVELNLGRIQTTSN